MADPATKLLAVYVNAFSPQIVLKKKVFESRKYSNFKQHAWLKCNGFDWSKSNR